jgi:pimeloyl-ACP methyl ester carboxylesterase
MLVTLGKHQIFFQCTGAGVPVVMMHAFPLNQTMFQGQRQSLADVARLVTFDVPGVGESTPSLVTIDDIADLAAALLDAEEIEKAVIGGVSMGGYAAFAFALRHPDRLRGLILANTRAAADTEEAKKGRREMAAVAREKGAAEIARRMLPKLLGETTHQERPAVVDHVRSMAESVAPETIARLLDALASRADSAGLLPQINVPTLVIAGEQDAIAPPEEASEWAARIPNAKFVAIARAGHLPNLETPEAFDAAVREFLQSLPR